MSNPDAITQGVCDLLLCGILHRRMYCRVLFNKYAVQILYFLGLCFKRRKFESSLLPALC